MGNDDSIMWLFDDGPQIDDKNQLLESTHRCPRHGGYCTPECALALIYPDGDGWCCCEVVGAIRDSEFLNLRFAQKVKWK